MSCPSAPTPPATPRAGQRCPSTHQHQVLPVLELAEIFAG